MEAAEPQPGPSPAAGPQPGGEEIDMSLDDIIKRHRKEQTDAKATGDRQRQQTKNRNLMFGFGRPRFRAWVQRNLQGPNRFRRGFGQQQYNRKPFRNTMADPRRRAAAALSGVSPLNRQALAQEPSLATQNIFQGPLKSEVRLTSGSFGSGMYFGPASGQLSPGTLINSTVTAAIKSEDDFAKGSSSGQPEARRRPPLNPRRFRAAAASASTPGRRRPFLLNRGPGFQQKRMQQRFQRGQMDANAEGKPPRMRRWRVKPRPGAVLTVSVANPQASQTNVSGAKRPFLPSQRPLPRMAKPQPKGVMLRFNFRAMANQTSLTLDERFSGLRNKRRFAAARSARRTVTMP